ncbi:MAG: hypothetical protein ACREAU_00825 [Nitrosopumilaceae archaeon]
MKLKELFAPTHPGNIQSTLKLLRENGSLPEIIEPFIYDYKKHFHILKEMTRSTGPTPSAFLGTENQILNNIQKHGEHIGDQDMFPVFHYQVGTAEYYGIVQDNKIVSYVYVRKDLHPKLYQWHNAFTLSPYRNQQHPKRLLYFIKYKLGYAIYDASAQQSPHGIQLIQSIGRDNRFKVSWINKKTGEKIEYNPIEDHDEHQPYRTKEKYPTDWRILIESSGPCARVQLFATNGTLDRTYINSNGLDVHDLEEGITYEEIENRLNFYFDKKRQRKII